MSGLNFFTMGPEISFKHLYLGFKMFFGVFLFSKGEYAFWLRKRGFSRVKWVMLREKGFLWRGRVSMRWNQIPWCQSVIKMWVWSLQKSEKCSEFLWLKDLVLEHIVGREISNMPNDVYPCLVKLFSSYPSFILPFFSFTWVHLSLQTLLHFSF